MLETFDIMLKVIEARSNLFYNYAEEQLGKRGKNEN